MAQVENHFTVFIRLPFNRGDFIDPPPVSWSVAKERQLWDVISRQARGNDIDWNGLADKLDATPQFLLQQAAWLYERQLSQVWAQMRKVNIRQSATTSPTPSSVIGSLMDGQAMKRGASGGSEVPSRLSTQVKGATGASREGGTPNTPAKSKASLPLRAPSSLLSSQHRSGMVTSSPMSRQSSKEHTITNVPSRRGSVQPHVPKSTIQNRAVANDSSDSDTQVTASKITSRRTNPSVTARRVLVDRREKESRRPSFVGDKPATNDDDEDSPPFLPFASTSSTRRQSTSQQDPSATLRGGFTSSQAKRPTNQRKTTSERITTTTASPQPAQSGSLISPTSSTFQEPEATTAQRPTAVRTQPLVRGATVLSPRQRAALAQLSPRNRPGKEGSDTSPSMGSSFSDLDDASITQSALEEALMSNMAQLNSNTSSKGGAGLASRVI